MQAGGRGGALGGGPDVREGVTVGGSGDDAERLEGLLVSEEVGWSRCGGLDELTILAEFWGLLDVWRGFCDEVDSAEDVCVGG